MCLIYCIIAMFTESFNWLLPAPRMRWKCLNGMATDKTEIRESYQENFYKNITLFSQESFGKHWDLRKNKLK